QPASGRAATRPEALVSYIPVIQEGAHRADEGAGEAGLSDIAHASFDRVGIVSTGVRTRRISALPSAWRDR
ncbi:hypothetical protein AB9E14_14520, partial [Rhizobium leguminosarum]